MRDPHELPLTLVSLALTGLIAAGLMLWFAPVASHRPVLNECDWQEVRLGT